jgi:hypothetical protein
MSKGGEDCRNRSKLPKSVEYRRNQSQTVEQMAEGGKYTRDEQQWIDETRRRLAQRRGKKPETKAGQIRALWPEIRAALADGQSLRSIRQWLDEEGDVVVTVQSLDSYLTRIRRKEAKQPAAVVPPAPPVSQSTSSEVRPSLRTPEKPRGFEYPPGPPDESKLI